MKILLSELRRIVRFILTESECPNPSCKSKNAYIGGMNNVECDNRKCKFYSKKQEELTRPEMKNVRHLVARKTHGGETIYPICNRDQLANAHIDRYELSQRFPKLHKSLSDMIGKPYDNEYDDERFWFVANDRPFSVQDDASGDEFIVSWNDDGDYEYIAVYNGNDPSEDSLEDDPAEGNAGFSFDRHLWYVPVKGKENDPAVQDLLTLA